MMSLHLPSSAPYSSSRHYSNSDRFLRRCHPAISLSPERRIGAKCVLVPKASSAPRREKDPKKRIVVTGMGLVSVFGNDVDAYYDKLLTGESGIGSIQRFDASVFPTRFGGEIHGFTSEGYIDAKNDRRLDDCIRYALVSGKKAMENAGFELNNLDKVNYINAHATSTLAGDLAEVNAIKKVFKKTSQIKMNATKSMIGHCLGAAGGLEAIATVKSITTGWLHPTINQFNIEPALEEFDTVPDVKQQHEVNVAISNSFGFGGHNSVVVFSRFEP